MAFLKNFSFDAFFFWARIQILANLCRFSIANRSTSRTPYEFDCFSVKFCQFGLWNCIFLENFCFGAPFFFCTRIQIRANLCSFSIWNGSMSRTLWVVHHFSTKFHFFGLQNNIFFENFHFSAHFFLHQNSDSRKFVQLFDWR